jgi:hypothetical protein
MPEQPTLTVVDAENAFEAEMLARLFEQLNGRMPNEQKLKDAQERLDQILAAQAQTVSQSKQQTQASSCGRSMPEQPTLTVVDAENAFEAEMLARLFEQLNGRMPNEQKLKNAQECLDQITGGHARTANSISSL